MVQRIYNDGIIRMESDGTKNSIIRMESDGTKNRQ